MSDSDTAAVASPLSIHRNSLTYRASLNGNLDVNELVFPPSIRLLDTNTLNKQIVVVILTNLRVEIGRCIFVHRTSTCSRLSARTGNQRYRVRRNSSRGTQKEQQERKDPPGHLILLGDTRVLYPFGLIQ